MKKSKIAVVGGGVAGLVAAWSLSKKHEVTLYEASKLGGHARSATFPSKSENFSIDMGVELFSEKQAPNFFELLKLFKIETFVAPLSFCAVFDNKDEYWDSTFHNGNLWNKIAGECSRFQIQMHELVSQLSNKVKTQTVREFLNEHSYSQDFTYKALLPLFTTFTCPSGNILDYSLTYCALSFTTGLLSFFQPTYWRKVKGGIKTYIDALIKDSTATIRENTPVKTVQRLNDKVVIRDDKDNDESFDYVVMATHADITLSLLDQPTEIEKNIFGNFKYTRVTSYLHKDRDILTPNIKTRACCEYNSIHEEAKNMKGSLTRISNALDPYRNVPEFMLVTFDPHYEISEDLVIDKKNWKLPMLRPQDMVNKHKLRSIQGKNRTWFCGLDTTFTGHEGSLLSGLVIAEAFGIDYPFADNAWAKIQYNVAKGIMGIYSKPEKIFQKASKIIYTCAMMLNMHKSQAAQAMRDLYF